MSNVRTTLEGGGRVHAVTLPRIPADYPDGGSVTVTADCGIGRGEALPANYARQATTRYFTEREVTCPACLSAN